ncbi:MAG: energy transducer TonB [Bacteroidales bacterium]|nr:energy transducer TonB [Bacteroidales bacterium]
MHSPYFYKKNQQGTVVVKFGLTKEGDVTDIRIKESISKFLDAEAIRAMKSMPGWKSGTDKKGNAVRVYFTLPFNLPCRMEKKGTMEKRRKISAHWISPLFSLPNSL